MHYVLWSYLVVACVLWCAFYVTAMRAQHVINALPILNKDTDFSPPMLSVIIAARNEGKTLSHALDTLIQQSYPQLEIIIVNDRSSDNTAAIIDEYAARDPRIHPIHISTLADEWLGKTHALHFASQQARGEWFLFTDADVHHSTRLWASAIHYAQEQQLDHLALLPKITSAGSLIQATTKAFGLLFLTNAKVEHIRNPDSPAAIGVGAFNLVNAEKFKRSAGFEWLRMEVADDYGLALMLKADGGRSDIATAYEDLHIEWYPNLNAMVHGLDKNIMAPGTQYKTHKLIIHPIALAALVLAPFVSLLTLPVATFWPGFLSLMFVSWLCISIALNKKESIWHWVLSPIGFIVIAYIFARACFLCLLRDGIRWRGTHYARNVLQKYQRVKL